MVSTYGNLKETGVALLNNAKDNAIREIKNFVNPLMSAYQTAMTSGVHACTATYDIITKISDPTFWTELSTYILEWATTSITSYTQDALLKLSDTLSDTVTNFPIDISSYTLAYTSAYIKENMPSLSSLMLEAEQQYEQKYEEEETKKKTSKLSKIKNKVSNGRATVNSYVTMAMSYVDCAVMIALSGEQKLYDYLVGIMNEYIYNYIALVRDAICQDITNLEKNLTRSIGRSAGEKIGRKTVNVSEKVLKKQINKIAKVKEKAQIKVKSAIAVALQKVKALVGTKIHTIPKKYVIFN